ncbi:MAG: DUF167 domain-containing protein [Patescibacteria group bacterium]
MRITVHVKPNAKTTELVSREHGVWTIKLHAPPMEGKANEELIRFLSEEFDVPKSSIEIVKGQTAKVKIVEIKQ